jgi:hypothetical protein
MSGQVGSIAVGRLYLWEPVPRAKPDGARLFKSDFPAGKFLRRELIPIAGFSAADHPLADSNNDSGLATRDPASERQDVVLDVTGTGAACAPLRRTRMRQLELALDRFPSPMVLSVTRRYPAGFLEPIVARVSVTALAPSNARRRSPDRGTTRPHHQWYAGCRSFRFLGQIRGVSERCLCTTFAGSD